MTRNRVDAEELVQETLIRTHESFEQFELPGTNPRTSLYRTLVRSFFNGFRKRQRELQQARVGITQDCQLANALAYLCSAPSAEAEVLMREPDDHVLRALRQLPVAFRTVVYLADVEGCTYREIADIMGTPPETVMSRLHCGRCRLRECLRDYAATCGHPCNP